MYAYAAHVSVSRSFSKYVGVSLVSASVLALQVIFTRIFSLMIWHHFTYLVIGVALLGGGAAGTCLAIYQWETEILTRRLGKFALAFSISILVSFFVIATVHFDPLAKTILSTLFGLTIYFGSLFAIFFSGGLTIVAAFRLWTRDVHRLYFADLFGAGVSMLGVVTLVQTLGGPGAIVVIALIALVASWLFGINLRIVAVLASVQIGLLITLAFGNSIQLPVPPSKSLHWALEASSARAPELTRWNPVARVDVTPPVDIPEPMIVGGVSSTYKSNGNPYSIRFVTLDGTSMTGLYRFDGDLARFDFLEYAIIGAPFRVAVAEPATLYLGVGGGIDILLARFNGAKQITAIDLNSDIVALLASQYADYTGHLANDPRVTLVTAEGRSFLMRTNQEYDLIQGIGLDNVAALSTGAYVLAESYLYTTEAFELAIARLSPRGIFAWTLNDTQPPRTVLRLTGMAVNALKRRGAVNPAQHLAIIGNESGTASTLLVARAPFTHSAIQQLRDWAHLNKFHILYDPFERIDTPFAEYVYAAEPGAFESAYPFNIAPVYDDSPYFYNFFKWSNLFFNVDKQASVFTRLPVGNLILITMLTLAAMTAVVFIIYPLARYKRSGLQTPGALATLAYFSALGAGYIFVEIVLIQRFILFIGYPTHAVTTTIFSMLTFSALGSLVSARLRTHTQLRQTLALLVILILAYIVVLPRVIQPLLSLDDFVRILTSVVLIAPLASLMGMPFPTGLRQMSAHAQTFVPWAWGMNGVFSVLGSTLVILVSMLTSFTGALIVAAMWYAGALMVASSVWHTRVTSA